MKDFGLSESLQELSAYIWGDGNVPAVPFQEDGDWTKYLPKYESQSDRFETYCCTVWGTQNCIETLHKRLYGEEPNYSERFTALLSGLKGTGGIDPQIPCESVRHDGVIDQKYMPMTDTKEEFFDTDGLTGSLLAKGQNWLVKHDFKHDWVWKGTRPANYIGLLKDALKTSPLGVSVTAWREENGVYVSDSGGNNHWVMLFKIDEEGYLWVFDSYDHTIKKLAKDHNIRRAKRYWINTKTKRQSRTLIGLLQDIIKRLTMKPTLVEVAQSLLGTDISPKDLVADEVGCAESMTNLMKKVYPETPIITGTYSLFDYLNKPTSNYTRVTVPTPGTVILCPTSAGKPFPGHVGIFMEDMTIASNDSATGRFIKNYNLDTWIARWVNKGGYQIFMFKHV